MQVLITGGSGYLGQHILQYLLPLEEVQVCLHASFSVIR
jgi:nucleoside-diphosphate-sugar epimerase